MFEEFFLIWISGSNLLFTIDVVLKLGPPPTCTGRKRRDIPAPARIPRQTSGQNTTVENSDEPLIYATLFQVSNDINDGVEIHSGIMVKAESEDSERKETGPATEKLILATKPSSSSKMVPLSLFYLFLLFLCWNFMCTPVSWEVPYLIPLETYSTDFLKIASNPANQTHCFY